MKAVAGVRSPLAQADLLQVSTEILGDVAVVRAVGEIDMVTAPQLAESLAAAESAVDRPRRVVADLAEVTFMASPGLTVLANHQRRCQDLGLSFVVATAQRAVTRTLAVTGLIDVLTVVADTDEALALPWGS